MLWEIISLPDGLIDDDDVPRTRRILQIMQLDINTEYVGVKYDEDFGFNDIEEGIWESSDTEYARTVLQRMREIGINSDHYNSIVDPMKDNFQNLQDHPQASAAA